MATASSRRHGWPGHDACDDCADAAEQRKIRRALKQLGGLFAPVAARPPASPAAAAPGAPPAAASSGVAARGATRGEPCCGQILAAAGRAPSPGAPAAAPAASPGRRPEQRPCLLFEAAAPALLLPQGGGSGAPLRLARFTRTPSSCRAFDPNSGTYRAPRGGMYEVACEYTPARAAGASKRDAAFCVSLCSGGAAAAAEGGVTILACGHAHRVARAAAEAQAAPTAAASVLCHLAADEEVTCRVEGADAGADAGAGADAVFWARCVADDAELAGRAGRAASFSLVQPAAPPASRGAAASLPAAGALTIAGWAPRRAALADDGAGQLSADGGSWAVPADGAGTWKMAAAWTCALQLPDERPVSLTLELQRNGVPVVVGHATEAVGGRAAAAERDPAGGQRFTTVRIPPALCEAAAGDRWSLALRFYPADGVALLGAPAPCASCFYGYRL
jgi:hypothetical protein